MTKAHHIAGKITKSGLKALKDGEVDDPNMELMLLVMSCVGVMNRDNCIRLCMQLCDEYGSAEMACMAIRAGDVEFTKAN